MASTISTTTTPTSSVTPTTNAASKRTGTTPRVNATIPPGTTISWSAVSTGSPDNTTGVAATISTASAGSSVKTTDVTANTPTGNSAHTFASNSTATSGSPATLIAGNSPTPGVAGSFTQHKSSIKPAVTVPSSSIHTASHKRSSTKSPVQTGTGHCGSPPTIANGKVNPNGPYTPGTAAMYTCSTGFTLVGQLTCIQTGMTWQGTAPQCVASNSSALGGNGKEAGDHNVYVGNGVPLWLAIVLGLTFGVLCLVMLTCLVMYCLRICGCYKRSLIGDVSATGAVVPGHTSNAHDARGIHEVPTVHKGTAMSVVELEPFNGYRTVTTEGRPPEDNRYHFTRDNRKGAQHPRRTNRFWEDSETSGSNQPPPRRKAKLPEKPTWMPHSQQRRKINTSTQ